MITNWLEICVSPTQKILEAMKLIDLNSHRIVLVVEDKKLSINSVIKNVKDGKETEEISNLDDFDIRYNKIQHQFKNTECGVYSINFIIRLVGGETFDEITNNILKDDFMNNCRNTYFRN